MAGLIAMMVGKLSGWLYAPDTGDAHGGHGEHAEVKRGYQVEVDGDTHVAAAPVEEEEPIDLAALMALANSDAGAVLAKKCVACHNFDAGSGHKVGPNLWNVVNAPIAGKADFNYSNALSEKGGNWNYENLYAFLNKPKKFAKGTKMAFVGIKKPEDLANMIAYLRTTHDNPPPLP